jgi:2-oxoglutarate dehydrogenase complex dehydrogenase (E1) component-like enzyme
MTQVNGHSLANLDPLGLDNRPTPIELDPALYGFTEADLDKECAPECAARAAPPPPPCLALHLLAPLAALLTA